MNIEVKSFPRKLRGIAKSLEIYGFGIVEYSFSSESGRMIALWDQASNVPGLSKYLRIIYPQGICTSEGYKITLISNCHDDHDSYAELNLKEDSPGLQKAKPCERVYFKYDPKNNLPYHEATLPNHIEREVKTLTSSVCVTNEDNQNLTPSQK